jgi:hypothetical protein
MLKQILLCTALLVPSAVFADDQPLRDQPDSSETNSCRVIPTPIIACERIPGCFLERERCFCCSGSCGEYTMPEPCIRDPRCDWNPGVRRCETKR